jgi:hypothetical protein
MDQKVFWVALCIAALCCLCSGATTIDLIYREGTYTKAFHTASGSHETRFDSGNTAESIFGRSNSAGYMPEGAAANELEKNLDQVLSPNTIDLHAAIFFDSVAEPRQDHPGHQPSIALSGLSMANSAFPELGTLTIGADFGGDPSLILMAVGSIGVLISSRMN